MKQTHYKMKWYNNIKHDAPTHHIVHTYALCKSKKYIGNGYFEIVELMPHLQFKSSSFVHINKNVVAYHENLIPKFSSACVFLGLLLKYVIDLCNLYFSWNTKLDLYTQHSIPR